MKLYSRLLFILAAIFLFKGTLPIPPDEGMFPLSEIHKLDLKKAGLKIEIEEIYNPQGVSLVDALVRVGGCTGSFVSDKGLIITNHHCAFDYVRMASTVENNYLENGFHAESMEKEIPAKGLTCMITESYRDVSAEILAAAENASSPSERIKLIQKKSRELIETEEKNSKDIRAEVSEMFTGKTYVLFRYKILKDIRLVFIPPRNIGEFGGETDNWVWPRHTGDFSFLRAYVAKDGSSAEYSKDNVPYKPKRFLKVNPDGVEEEDFVFILGYPGRTFRHQPAGYLKYQKEIQLPYIEELYTWLIKSFEEFGKNNPETALFLASKIKSMANVQKNYKGKLLGLERLNLIEKKLAEEKELEEYIKNDVELNKHYGTLFSEINEVYAEMRNLGRTNLVINQLRNNCVPYRLAHLLVEYMAEMKKEDSDRKMIYSEKERPNFLAMIHEELAELNLDIDKVVLTKILGDAAAFPEFNDFHAFSRFRNEDNIYSSVQYFVENILTNSLIYNKQKYLALLERKTETVEMANDPLIRFVKEVNESYVPIDAIISDLNGKINVLLPKLLDVKKLWQSKNFIPDANSTLRLTFGYIRGYSPADATYYSPITTLKGVVEKSRPDGDFAMNKKVIELARKKDYGRYKSKKLNDVPVAILYNMDTTGGNSGSPVMNAKGELIGVNFDRAFEATINDYAWSELYSRSIGVDIRYVLWVTEKVGGALNVIEELGIH